MNRSVRSETMMLRGGLKATVLAASALVVALTWAGCSDDHDHNHGSGGAHTSPFPACNEITQACHHVDKEEGPIHTCHDEAHGAKSNDDCLPKRDHCLKICNEAAADAGESHDAGHSNDGG